MVTLVLHRPYLVVDIAKDGRTVSAVSLACGKLVEWTLQGPTWRHLER